MGRNKYPQRKKCPTCGNIMTDGVTCYGNKCYRNDNNTELKTVKDTHYRK